MGIERGIGRWAATAVAGLGLLGCPAGANTPGTGGTREPARLHAVHGERLEDVMGELRGLVHERMRTQLALEEVRYEHTLELEDAAAGLRETAALVRDPAVMAELTDADRLRFDELAIRLGERAGVIEALARARDLQGVEVELEGLEHTCDSCHALFRAR